MVLIEYNYSEPQQAAANKPVYDEQFIVAKLAAIKRCAKKFLLNAHIHANVAERIEATNVKATTQNNNDRKFSEISEILSNDKKKQKSTASNAIFSAHETKDLLIVQSCATI